VTARWHPDALAEADAAAEFYRDKRRELARPFLNSLAEALNHIELHPHIWDRAWRIVILSLGQSLSYPGGILPAIDHRIDAGNVA
jgi:hypothetical protein